MEISDEDIAPVTELESSVCALLTLDLRSRSLINGQIDTSQWEQSLNAAGLTSRNWLLAYEAANKGWLAAPAPNFVEVHPYFGVLKKHHVSFYDVSKNVKNIKSRKPKLISPALMQYLSATKDGFAPAHAAAMSLGEG